MMRKYIKGIVHALARAIQPPAPAPQANVAVGDIVTCGALIGRVEAIKVNECGTVDAEIIMRDGDGMLITTTLPADGRYDIELDVIAPSEAISRGLLFSRWRSLAA